MKIIIDGKTVNTVAGKSVLDAALEAGIYIPHLCKHPDLEAVGGCRLCSVEIEGIDGAVCACKTEVFDGMKVTINGEEAEKVRKTAMELILATHPADCTGCPKYGKCELQSMYQYMGVSAERWRKKARTVATDSSNPLIEHLFTRCVRCGRCVRACRELRGVKVLDYQKQPDGTVRIGIDGSKSLKEAGCRFCGACIEVCPTGSIMDTLGLMKEERSYADNVVPCRGTCPAGIDIPQYLRYIKDGDFAKATCVIREKVPFPETLGSVCTHACEDNCKRGNLNEPLSICRLKRAASVYDNKLWKAKSIKCSPTSKQVAIIGSGPAGLTAAYYLAKKGHKVVVFEKNAKAGGQCRYGIPAYRLPDETLDKEINEILEVGIELKTNTQIDLPKSLLDCGYDAVLVAVGTHQGTKLPLEGNDLPQVYINTEFLKNARENNPTPIGKKVVVLGGGNVAYDCARTAVRLGAEEVHIACLESYENMTASKQEREEGKEEGIILHDSVSFLKIIGTKNVEGVEIQKISEFYFDQNHKAVIKLVENSNEIIVADTVIFAVGQRPENTPKMELDLVHNWYIKIDENLETSVKNIYAVGDVVTGTKSVIEAIAGARKAAKNIDISLGGDGVIEEVLIERDEINPYIGREENFADLERNTPVIVSAQSRINNFDEIEKPFEKDVAQCEAQRCLQCDLRLSLHKPKLWNEY